MAEALPGGLVDLSIGTPCDPPPAAVVEALGASGRRARLPAVDRHAPPTARRPPAGWPAGSASTVDPAHVAACVGTKELVAGVPQWLRLRRPDLDTVLYPAISYPTYAMGATLAGCRAVPYRALDDIDPADAARALCLWVNVARQPHRRARRPRRGRGVGPRPRRAGAVRRVLRGVHLGRPAAHDPRARPRRRARRALAVEALEPGRRPGRRSTPATPTWSATCPRCASTPASWCPGRCRRPPWRRGPTTPTSTSSASATAAGSTRWPTALRQGRASTRPLPAGAFYLWAPAPDGDAWALARRLAETAARSCRPASSTDPTGAGFVRVAVVQPDDRIALVAERLGAAG